MTCRRLPCAFLGHGGGPLPLMGEQPAVADTLRSFSKSIGVTPAAVLFITAHWVTDPISVSSGDKHSLLFDYGGFPPETYAYTYPAPGAPELAERVSSLLSQAGISVRKDPTRGWDHGTFVPAKLMYPGADVPIVSLGLHKSLDPDIHLNIGKALAPLRDEGVLIVGSGMSFHNFAYFFARDARTKERGVSQSHIWNDFLFDTLVSGGHTRAEQLARLRDWSSAPSATEAHPLGQEDHLLPLHVVLGAAGEDDRCALVGAPAADKTEIAFSNFEWKSVE